MRSYTAQMAHTPETIKEMLKCQDRLCHPILNYIGGAGCVILVILAIMLQPYIGTVSTGVFSFLGCFLFVTNRHRTEQQFEAFMERVSGAMPEFRYSFTDSGITVKRDSRQETIAYHQITDLAENNGDCFFIYQKKATFMFEKKTAEKLPELKAFLEEKTGCKWKKAKVRVL